MCQSQLPNIILEVWVMWLLQSTCDLCFSFSWNDFFCIFRPLAMELAQPSLFDYLPRRPCPPGKIRTNFGFFWSIFLFSLKQIIFIFHEGWCFSWVRTVEHIVGIATPKSGVWPHYKLDYLSRLRLKQTTLQKEFCSLKKKSPLMNWIENNFCLLFEFLVALASLANNGKKE